MENAKPAYLKQDKTGRVYPFTEALAGRKDMRPCAENGVAVPDGDANPGKGSELPPRAEGQALKDYLATLTIRQIADYMQEAYSVTVQPGKKDEMIAKAVDAVGEAA